MKVIQRIQNKLFSISRQLREKKYQAILTHSSLELSGLNGIHKGEEAVIIGMGPSLRPDDLKYFDQMHSFACNKVFLGFDQTKWRPTYYSVVDVLVAENNLERILKTDFGDAIPIHTFRLLPQLHKQKGALFYKYSGSFDNFSSSRAKLPANLEDGILAHGYSVVLDQIQIAYAMGFKRVFLVGLDFSFSGGEQTTQKSQSGDVLVSAGERNHFHKDYRKQGETWTVPKLEEMKHAFACCRAAFEQDGRQLINASRMTELDVLERASFEEVFCKG